MSAAKVELTSEVFWTCALHALSTEVEEVMGLLLGDVLYQADGAATVRIWAVMPQIRTDRRKDRVEASPEQMARCSAVAEKFSKATGTLTRVVGWVHSHPHITVLPSHVDVRTQAMYQMLDQNFVGLIISAFNEDSTSFAQKVQITAFQSASSEAQPPEFTELASDDIAQAMAASTAELEASAPGCHVMLSYCLAATHRAGDWTRREVPLSIVESHGDVEQSLTDIKGLLKILFDEERAAFEAAVEEALDPDGNIDPITLLQHTATYQQHLSSLVELVLGPTLHSMRICGLQADLQRQQLQLEQQHLQDALQWQQIQPDQLSDLGSPSTSSLDQVPGPANKAPIGLLPAQAFSTGSAVPSTTSSAADQRQPTTSLQQLEDLNAELAASKLVPVPGEQRQQSMAQHAAPAAAAAVQSRTVQSYDPFEGLFGLDDYGALSAPPPHNRPG